MKQQRHSVGRPKRTGNIFASRAGLLMAGFCSLGSLGCGGQLDEATTESALTGFSIPSQLNLCLLMAPDAPPMRTEPGPNGLLYDERKSNENDYAKDGCTSFVADIEVLPGFRARDNTTKFLIGGDFQYRFASPNCAERATDLTVYKKTLDLRTGRSTDWQLVGKQTKKGSPIVFNGVPLCSLRADMQVDASSSLLTRVTYRAVVRNQLMNSEAGAVKIFWDGSDFAR